MVPFKTTSSNLLSSFNIKSILDINTVTGVFSSRATSVVLGGVNNNLNANNAFILGSNIDATQDNLTYVNSLSSTNDIYGSGLLKIGTGSDINIVGAYGLFTSPMGINAGFTIHRGDDSSYASLDFLENELTSTGWSIQMQPSNSDLQFVDRVNNSNAFTIQIGGNVGIGTTTPAEKLEVNGNIKATGGDSNQWNSNWTTTNTNSASWTSVYNTFNTNSASYATGGFVYEKFLPLSGGSITGNLVVQGSLTALGTATFANTIFTTTSALSVINTGPGPALYVFQAVGTSDVASFYDGDGVEVLHVGNANPGGNGFVGINESFPAVELSVRGAISASKTITALGGNSNQWNSNWTTTNTNSASWTSVYNSFNTNSAKYDSVYNTTNSNSAKWSNWSSVSGNYALGTQYVKLSGDTMTGSLNIIGNLSASAIGYFNHVAAATKSFYIPHPSKPGMHLQYGSLESPYHGIRLTGNGSVKCGDSVVIQLPDYIFSLVHQEGVNIQLTNYQHNKTLFVDDIDVSNNTFTVKCEKKLFDKGEYKFFWSFTAIRKDIPNLQVEC
jgi:hypothetical protein